MPGGALDFILRNREPVLFGVVRKTAKDKVQTPLPLYEGAFFFI